MPIILGVDPGVHGGIAFFYPTTRRVDTFDIPSAAGQVDAEAIVALLLQHGAPDEAFVERAQSMPKQGVASTFKYGVAYGTILATLATAKIPTNLVTPRKWKTAFGLDKDKEKSRALAIRLFPGCDDFRRKKDHGKAEAALIARYGAGTLGLLGQQEDS
jgi:Holliday junction resolvasome RuvABC endonuclease subunit